MQCLLVTTAQVTTEEKLQDLLLSLSSKDVRRHPRPDPGRRKPSASSDHRCSLVLLLGSPQNAGEEQRKPTVRVVTSPVAEVPGTLAAQHSPQV